jgi:hypothetical protein
MIRDNFWILVTLSLLEKILLQPNCQRISFISSNFPYIPKFQSSNTRRQGKKGKKGLRKLYSFFFFNLDSDSNEIGV